MTPERDYEFKDKDISAQYHEHLRRKEEIRTKIEKMTREKNFLEQLNSNEVAYMFQKDKELKIKEERQEMKELFSPQKIIQRLEGASSPQKSRSPVKKRN